MGKLGRSWSGMTANILLADIWNEYMSTGHEIAFDSSSLSSALQNAAHTVAIRMKIRPIVASNM